MTLPPFGFAGPAEIVFGRGRAAAEAAPRIAAFGNRVLLVRGRSPARAAWLREALIAQGCEVEEIAGQGEPNLDAVTAAAEAARRAQAVVSLGGGAVVDLGKAAAALATADGPPLRYLEVVGEGRPLPAAPLPFVAIPPTAGAGAEATRNAVVEVPAHRRKVSLRDARMLPRLALIDPALADGCPWAVTLASGLDAVTQVIEPWICARATPFTDALCEPAIPRGLAALIRLSQGEDPAARDEMAWVALCGGLALANSGLGVVHGLAGVLGGMTGAPHGAICGRLLPHGLATNAARAEGEPARRIARVRGWIAEALGAPPAEAFAALDAWSTAQGLPGLAAMGLAPGERRAAAEAAAASSSMKANPVALSAGELEATLAAAA